MTETLNDAEFWRRRLVAVVQDEKEWQAELNRRRGTIEAQAERLATGERNHAALEAVRQQLAAEVEALRDVVADREREIGRLFGEVSEAHRLLQEVWSSLSWRATIPLRSVSARLPGLGRGLRSIGERYPHLIGAGVGAVRGAGRMLLLKSPVVQASAPPLPAPTPTIALPADPAPVDLLDEPPRPQSWLCTGDTMERLDDVPRTETAGSSPVPGDHVLFAAATWTAPDIGHLTSLVERGIDFSLLVGDDVPLEAAAWLRMILTHARCVFVPDATTRDRILRWAVLSDVYVSAAVEFGSDPAAAGLDRSGPATPLGQPGRLFVPGIVAPATLPTLAAAQAWCTEDDPQVSILIVNRNAYQLTRACIQQIWANTSEVRYEIVVADGGSSPADRCALSILGRGVRLLPVGADRFFGEACNIAAEHAQAPLLCLLSNDCFVQPGWLETLVAALEADPSVGAAGPLLLSVDMTLQKAEGTITEQGVQTSILQSGTPGQPVDYALAATLLVRRDAYLRVGGFDLMYEPASFEDVDLCFKLKALGLSVRSCPAAAVIQAEADGDPAAEARHKALIDLNRSKFVSRWSSFLRSRSDADLATARQQIVFDALPAQAHDAPPAQARNAALPAAVLYTPYPITPGGGERFLLTIASELMRDHRVTIVTPNPYSQLRLQNIAHIFGLDLSRCQMQTEAAFAAGAAPDLMVVLGNFVYPPIEARTPNAVFICQFPFPLEGHPPRIDRGYRAVIAYSDYARTHILANMSDHGMPDWPVEIVYPPVPQIVADRARKRPMILTVGRFFTGGHTKRHDLMIDAFRRVLDGVGGGVEMHLAGSSTPGAEHLRYLETLMRAAEGMPVTFHVNAARDTLEDLYRRAAVYWHATGLGADLAAHPEQAEHFGISLVEAMSSECVPMAFDAGGPREIITPGVDGFLYASLDELVSLTTGIIHADAAERRAAIGAAAAERARAFAPDRFGARVRSVLLTSAGLE